MKRIFLLIFTCSTMLACSNSRNAEGAASELKQDLMEISSEIEDVQKDISEMEAEIPKEENDFDNLINDTK